MSLLLLFQSPQTQQQQQQAANIVPLLMMRRRQDRMLYLRQATSQTVMIGPYTGSDGAALTGLTLTQSTFMLSKNGTAYVAKNETTNGSHRILGMYSVMFDDSDTGSAGRVQLVSSAAAALPLWMEFMVLPTSVYDSVVNSGTPLPVNVVQWNGTAPNGLSAGRVDASVGAMANTVINSASIADNAVQRMSNLLATDIRSIETVATIADRSPIQALRALRNRITTSGGLTVYKENDTTAAWSAVLTTNGSAAPIVESDPG